jgi:hypothetical protein
MNRELAEAVVGCLRSAEEAPDASGLRHFKARDWQHTFRWLDRSGLTLYLLRCLHQLEATELLPATILTRFEENLVANRKRLDSITNEFASINRRFHRAGVHFAVIKGFSLVPAFCPDAALRAPSDLDYLVDRPSLPAAQRVLAEAGYCLQRFSDIEFKYGKPSSRIPTVSDDPYSPETEPLVELHLAFWNRRANRILINEPQFPLDQITDHSWQGLRFPVLKEEDAFVLQILHVFQHTLEGWVKLCWLLELGYLARARCLDTQFWGRVDIRMREVPGFSEFAAIVLGLVDRVFVASMPPMTPNWRKSIRPPAKLWLENYGRSWAIGDHPYDSLSFFSASKLSLFLHREFVPDPQVRKEITQQRLFPWKQPEQIAVPGENTSASSLTARRLQRQFVLQRLIFHLGSTARYLLETPRWRQLHRGSTGLVPSGLHRVRQPDSAPPGDLSNRGITPD